MRASFVADGEDPVDDTIFADVILSTSNSTGKEGAVSLVSVTLLISADSSFTKLIF